MILINESSSQSAYELAENFKKHKELWLKILAYKLGINPENITDVAVGIQNREKIRSYEDKMDALIVKTDTRLRYGGGFEVLVVNDRNRRMEPAVGRIMASANKGSSVDIMVGLLLPEGRPNWKSLERSYNVNDVIVVYSDVDLPPEMPGDTEHLYLNPKDQYNRLDVRDRDPILGVRGLNVDESCNTQYCLDFIDNVDSPNIPVDQIECDDYDIICSIESMMSSYGVTGNIRTMAEKAAKAIRSGFSYTTPDKRWSIEFPPKLNENASGKSIGKKYLSPFEGEKLYNLIKTAIAGDTRLKMRTVVDTRRNARPFVHTGQNGAGYWVMDSVENEKYGFNVEWNGKFKSVAEINTLLQPVWDIADPWCDERENVLDIMTGFDCDITKERNLDTGRFCFRFKYAKEYLDSMKKAQKKKLKESSIVLNVDDPADAAKIGGKQNAKAVIVKYDGKFHVNNRYDSISGKLWLDERPFDTERAASDYRDYLNSHGDY